MKKRILFSVALVAAVFIVTLSGCSQKNVSATNKATDEKTIYVGTQGDYPPFAYTDDKGNPAGFDIEVIKEIDKRLPKYKFEFSVAPWDSIFISLDSDRTQVVADEIAINPEREAKYLFSNSYFNAQSVILVKAGRTDISTLDDLVGKTVGASVGDSYTQLLEAYNSSHPGQINLKYYTDNYSTDVLQDVANGRVDAYINDPVMAKAIVKELGLDVVSVGQPIQSDAIALAFAKNETGKELKAAIDPIIAEMIKDGTLKNLSETWTQGDYIPK